MKKIVIKNSNDNISSRCFLTGTEFLTARGIGFYLNDRAIDPMVALKNTAYDLEFAPSFVVPENYNSRIKIGEYLTTIGITRNHRSYFPAMEALSQNLPVGEYPKHQKEEHT